MYKPEKSFFMYIRLRISLIALDNLGEQQEDLPGLQGQVLAYQQVQLDQGQVQEQRQEAAQMQEQVLPLVQIQVQVLSQVQLAGQRRLGLLLVEGLLAVPPSQQG